MAQTEPTAQSVSTELWQQLERAIDAREGDRLVAVLHELPPEDTAYTIARLDPDRRSRMLSLLAVVDPDLGADLMEHFDDSHAADMIEDLPAETAAALVDQMDSDEQADVLAEIAPATAEAILEKMDPEEAEDVRERLQYPEDTAGGLMITEYLVYPADEDVKTVRRDLRDHADKYNEYEVRFLYAVDAHDHLVGVVPMRALLMTQPGEPLSKAAMSDDIVSVNVHTSLEDVEDLFDRVDLMAIPVLNDLDKLVGVVRRAAVQEAVSERAQESLAKFGGIIRGEEIRSMPTWNRAARRLAFLIPIMCMTLVSAAVVWTFQDLIGKHPTLAAFLPVVAGLCGSSGGQAVAVSIRELSLGLVRFGDVFKVLGKEASVAMIMGSVMGVTLFMIAWLVEGHIEMGFVVGIAAPVVMVIATSVGGSVPVILRGLGFDPAMLSGPVVQTTIDLVAFFTVLSLATILLASLIQAHPS